MRNKRSLIFIAFYMAYTSIYIARLNLSVASPLLIEQSVLNTVQLGMLGSIFSVVYASGRLINGQISDSRSPRFMIAMGLGLVALSNLVLGRLPAFYGMAPLWALNALGQSMLWSSMLVILSKTYEPSRVKKVTAWLVTAVGAGSLLGVLMNTALVERLGSGAAFMVPGSISLLVCIIILLTVEGKKPEAGEKKSHASVFALLKDRSVRKQLVPALSDGAIKDNITLWMTVFFVENYQIDLAASAGFVLFIPVLGMLGRMAYPFCFKLCGEDENRLSLRSFLICALLTLPLCLKAPAWLAAACLAALYAMTSLANTSIISIFPHRFAESNNVASVSGLMDFAAYLGSGISAAVYGVVIEAFGYRPMYISWIAICLISAWALYGLAAKKGSLV